MGDRNSFNLHRDAFHKLVANHPSDMKPIVAPENSMIHQSAVLISSHPDRFIAIKALIRTQLPMNAEKLVC
jgi:hypothetical protein